MAGWLVVAFCVFLTSLADVGQSRLTITSSTPSGSVMPSGERFDLSCSSSQPWFLCIWEGPMGLACQCQSQEGGVRQMCFVYFHNRNNAGRIASTPHTCGANFPN